MLVIDKYSRVPIYEQVIEQMERLIMYGDYDPAEALPSVRALSAGLGVNPNTLQKAYTELERRGLCKSVPGSGRFIEPDAREKLLNRARTRLDELGALAGELSRAGVTRDEMIERIDDAIKGGNRDD